MTVGFIEDSLKAARIALKVSNPKDSGFAEKLARVENLEKRLRDAK